jgi:hypothetical protein
VIVEELLPVASGLVIGSILGLLRPSLRVPIGVVLISWSFLLIDILLVAISAGAGLFVTHRLRRARRS